MINYQDYFPSSTGRVKEDIEWSITYSYETLDTVLPRVFLIGDSICNGYQSFVRNKLAGKVNVTYWASSKCVTDPTYLRELDYLLDCQSFDIITFNNGLHSLSTNRAEWENCYSLVLSYLRAKAPQAKLSLVTCTPNCEEKITATVKEFNEYIFAQGEKNHLPVIDLFAPMDVLDRKAYWVDAFHFADAAKEMQAAVLAEHICGQLQEKIK